MTPVVTVRGLSVDYRAASGQYRAVDDVEFEIHEGEAFGLVGESGSGKTTIALALTRYLPPRASLHARRLEVAGKHLRELDAGALRRHRRDEIGVVFQEPGRALNPTANIGAQLAESFRLRGASRKRSRTSAVTSLAEVGFSAPEHLLSRYPHQLSGGQQQRVMIAMALASRPKLLILDEPATGLDASTRGDVLSLISRLQTELRFASLVISHDLDLVSGHCARVGVLDRGRLLETGKTARLLAHPEHPRTRALVAAASSMRAAPRPPLRPDAPVILTAAGIRVRHGARPVLNGVDLSLRRGETLGLVGESGSGKTTLARVVAGIAAHEGSVVFHGAPRNRVQMVFQSPDAALNPRRSVRQTLNRARELLHGEWSPEELADRTGLSRDVLGKLPHQLSGGQKQRVTIARAFAGGSSVVVCDEPTSALDASVQASVLDLLIELQERTGVAYLFISHDLAVVKRIAHRVAVLSDGRIVETGTTAAVLEDSHHPRTRGLLLAHTSDRCAKEYAMDGGKGDAQGDG